MSFSIWTPPAASSEAFAWCAPVWRMVEAQHIASSMKLVDTPQEHDVLESLLESSKPTRSDDTIAFDYLLATPFRYDPLRGGSRFRSVIDPGVFYGAESARTAGAELAHSRWKFLNDAIDLVSIDPVPHTAFRVEVSANVVDLQRPPFDRDSVRWQHPTDYTATQAFARVARDADVAGILYRSVRARQQSWCLALLTPRGFAAPKPDAERQTWYLAVTRQHVTLRRDTESMQFSAAEWSK